MQTQITVDQDLLKVGLNVVVVVVRGDGRVVQQVPWSTAVSRLIGSFLNRLPKRNWFLDKLGYTNKRDEFLSEFIQLAGAEERKRYLSIGLQPWVWKGK